MAALALWVIALVSVVNLAPSVEGTWTKTVGVGDQQQVTKMVLSHGQSQLEVFQGGKSVLSATGRPYKVKGGYVEFIDSNGYGMGRWKISDHGTTLVAGDDKWVKQ